VPTVIGHLAVGRINDPGWPGIDVAVALVRLDIFDASALAPPEALHVGLPVCGTRWREGLRLRKRACVKGGVLARTFIRPDCRAAALRMKYDGSHAEDRDSQRLSKHGRSHRWKIDFGMTA
jgi:hypothetical protein